MTRPTSEKQRTSLVLCLDTSSALAGVALVALCEDADARLVASRAIDASGLQTRMLLGLVEQCLDEAKAGPGDLGAIVVGTGPGTFTGVRIGVATARAAALALDIPVAGVTSLSALTVSALSSGLVADSVEVLVPVVDARRGQVFGAAYRRVPAGSGVGSGTDVWERCGDLFASAPDSILDEVAAACGPSASDRPLFLGHVGLLGATPGIDVVTAEIEAAALLKGQRLLGRRTWTAPDLQERRESAAGAPEGAALVDWLTGLVGRGSSGSACGRPGEPGTPESVRPVYVRAPDADHHITKMKDPWQS